MLFLITAVFLIGYLFIALEHTLKINKAGTALITGVVLWVIYMAIAPGVVPYMDSGEFANFLGQNPGLNNLPVQQQVVRYVEQIEIIRMLGETSEILFFLIGAMTIVELIDVHGGFDIITQQITTRNKRKLLWIIGLLTFFMSAILDNLTTAIVMITLLHKIVANYKERWIFGAIVIIAANSGGAWSPIGDVTTIMLWVRGNVTVAELIPGLILPCLVSFLVPVWIAGTWLHGEVTPAPVERVSVHGGVVTYHYRLPRRQRVFILIVGILCLISVPVFKGITHLPPFMGILLALGIMWVYTELMYKRKSPQPNHVQPRIPYVLRRIDTSTILFFLGILTAVSALQASGVLHQVSIWLDNNIHDVFAINILIGFLSAVVDNVPLVAGSIATYPIMEPGALASMADPAYSAFFVQDGIFWEFLAYCAGVGGSMLIIGSAAGVVVMGIEKINFMWYLKHISWIAMVGYLAGAAVYILQVFFETL